ncbi:hypothetical protein NC653_026790 [Populus alba x Populus x berolinensis]|uniref:Uncharacterized protein n=1 Tax=Populus alba x Populus x berolinensis TaxID=444605 RepID=A0AAD6M3X0_9ROSI|nr:hypothetical protein NC653_026790 [Populus alba x Populus x berolinensis]
MKIDSVEGSYLDPLADKVLIGSVALEMAHKDLLHRNVVPDLSDWLYCKMLPSSVEQFIIELVAWAGRLSIPPPKNLLDISNVFFQWTSWYQNLQEWSGLINGKFQRRAITLLCKGLYWSIWIARNRLIFESKAPDWDMIFDLTFHRLAFWLKSSVTNFSYTGSDLFRNPECIMNWTN